MNNGKNVDSANLCMVFSVSLVFCLATIGVNVFRCGDFSCRTFLYADGVYMSKNMKEKSIDVTGIRLTPAEPTVCLGNGEMGFECCCDACDSFLLCFPEFDAPIKEERILERKDHTPK